ncbi:MAG: DUF1566 domain-containing protein [Bacteroidales bacterium]|nr:DUF1566 domain-containing protein [Bacteroidales bacterium]
MKKIIFFITAMCLFAMHGCQKDPDNTIDNRIEINDKVIPHIGSADISGTISCPIENINVELLVDDAEDMSAPTKYKVDINSDNSFTVKITQLNPATTYYYKFRAYTNVDDIEFEVKSFTTTMGEGTLNGYDWVDLGLPSGLKWATCNVGATTPEGYGNFYAWGETTTKTSYDQSNSVTYGQQISDISGNATYDAARANWGSTWRMPTKAEAEELRDNCTWTWTTQNGTNGYRVTGPNGNSIFLPAAGYCNGSSRDYVGECGFYWSSTPYEGSTYYAYYLYFNSGSLGVNWYGRNYGHTVRPVSE